MLKQMSKIIGRLCMDVCNDKITEIDAIQEYKQRLTRLINLKEKNNIDFTADAELYSVIQSAEEDYMINIGR